MSLYLLRYRSYPIKENKGDRKKNFAGLFWMDRNIVFCYGSLLSMVENSKLFMEYLLKKPLFKKIPERKSVASLYSFSVMFNTKCFVKGGGDRQLQTLDIYNCNFINSAKSCLLKLY